MSEEYISHNDFIVAFLEVIFWHARLLTENYNFHCFVHVFVLLTKILFRLSVQWQPSQKHQDALWFGSSYFRLAQYHTKKVFKIQMHFFTTYFSRQRLIIGLLYWSIWICFTISSVNSFHFSLEISSTQICFIATNKNRNDWRDCDSDVY